ncbi:hypothetical protein WCLP8_3800013 [uncultured Gammaproteobacteria bacterium]
MKKQENQVSPDSVADLAARLQAIGSVIGSACGAGVPVIEENRGFIDLVGLDVRVGAVCVAVKQLDRNQAQTLLPALEAVVDGLDALSATLTRRYEDQGQPARLDGAVAPAVALYRARAAYCQPIATGEMVAIVPTNTSP